jgi:hypothetical protein
MAKMAYVGYFSHAVAINHRLIIYIDDNAHEKKGIFLPSETFTAFSVSCTCLVPPPPLLQMNTLSSAIGWQINAGKIFLQVHF